MKKIFKLLSKSTIKHAIAFTLAEVVLVMGIIGVVGVLAVTNAKKDTDTAEKVAQLKKTYDILNTAFAQAVMENGAIKTWGTDGALPTTAEIEAVIAPYLKLLKNCGTGTGCWKEGKPLIYTGGESLYNLNSNTDYYKAILSNGASIALYNMCYGEYNICGARVIVDVNGLKGLNMYGNDVFAFIVENDGSIHPAMIHSGYNPDANLAIGSFSNDDAAAGGSYATAWALKFGNMDYLKSCKSSLSWTGDHTCR